MNHIRLLGPQHLAEFLLHPGIPNGFLDQHESLDFGIGVQPLIAPDENYHLVSGALQQLAFLLEDDVLTSGLLIMAMDQDYLHSLPFPVCKPRLHGRRTKSQFGTYSTPFRLLT